ncbi:MAG: hypothetical protein KDC98_04745 [Planctomycetes bacterium]|nr:hypothetical protein [Planctomycetota bacterium]
MSFPLRLALAIALLAAFGGAIAFLALSGEKPTTRANAVRWESAVQCKKCHEAVYDEWLGSHHQIAFTNPEVKKLSEDFRKEECMDCHLPRPLAVTGFGNRTLPRRTHFDEGVSCISCHLAPDGGILGRNDRPEVPCAPRRSEDFFGIKTCESCHNQHWTTDQWRASSYARQGIDCSSCHMPEVARKRGDKSERMGRGHVFPGAHDLATLRKAGRFEVTRDGSEVVLTLTNEGAGHNFPTEERHRAVDIMYRFVDGDAAAEPSPWTLAWRARQPYRDDPEPVGPGAKSQENTQLPAHEAKALRLPIPPSAKAIEARLWYRLTPFCGDDSPLSTLLEERRLDL